MARKLIASFAALASCTGFAFAQAPKAAELLADKPKMAGVAVSTPAEADLAACKVEVREWPESKGVKPRGVVVTDGNGRKLRVFIDTAGGSNFNIKSYFTDGVESFRELDANANGKPDAFRWLGPNGSKHGADSDEDGTIDRWVTISAEEASQEVFAALQSGDAKRFKALLMTEDELAALGLPAPEATRIKQKLGSAADKFARASKALALTAKSKWMHAELSPPQTAARDTLGTAEDLVKHRSVPVLFDAGDGKTMAYLATGDMIQVGKSWRLIDGPNAGLPADENPDSSVAAIPEHLRELMQTLSSVQLPKTSSEMPKYHLQRAEILAKFVEQTKGTEQLPWLKQLIDSYSAALEGDPSNANALATFKAWQKAIDAGGASETKAYVAFRTIGVDFAVGLVEAGKDAKKRAAVDAGRKEALEAFVKNYGTSTDAPEAMLQLAMGAEFTQSGEAEAKGWYEKLVKEHGSHAHAAKASGALKRLNCEGKKFELTGETFDGKAFEAESLAGKPAIVYYWASWGTTATDDLKALAKLETDLGSKARVVLVCLDDASSKDAAARAIQASGLKGTALYAPGGLDRSPLATAYGIHMIPHVFVLDKDAKVNNRNGQYGADLKADLEKLAK